jgi:DNA-binding XRE family transcriptional regulator
MRNWHNRLLKIAADISGLPTEGRNRSRLVPGHGGAAISNSQGDESSRRLRVGRGLSQESLAVDAGIDRTYVSRLERGLENPSVVVLEKLAIALKSSIPDLFVSPAKGEAPPRPLKAGRRPRR